jgi:16S rRNA processing protein RimM
LSALPLSDRRERFGALRKVTVAGRALEIENAWWHQDRLVLKFRGIDSISDAEALAGAEVEVAPEERVSLDQDEYFLSDLVGCSVVDQKSGTVLGTVDGWEETGGGPMLLNVGDVLIPFARTICVEVNPSDKRIVVDLPEGLAELNQP